MSWYQAISLLLGVYFLWGLSPKLYNFIHKQKFTIDIFERVFYTAVIVNLALAFVGTPW